MVGMMGHDEASELLGAYALDAVEPEEAAAVERHLESCPRCRDELRSHREVVGVLAYAGQEAPEGLWDRVVAGIHDSGAAAEEAPQLSLRVVRDGGTSSATVTGDTPAARTGGPARRRRARLTSAMSVLAAAAVVVIALLGVEVVRLQNRTDHLSGEVSAMTGQPSMATVQRALTTPGAHVVALKPVSGGAAVLDAVVLPGGQGYLYDAKLSPLSPAQTYQLWGVVGDQRISYGVLGSAPAAVTAFRASSGVHALAVTAEVAGGVVTSTQTPVAVGIVG